jgi:hypothetical protein
MAILSNQYVFPLLQIGLLAFLVLAVWCDYRPLTPGGINATPSALSADAFVKRGPESMSTLQWVTGLVIAAIITIFNKSVFDDDDAGWRHYSAIINAVDLFAVVYLCYVSPWTRNQIIALNNRLTEERRL